MLPRFRPGNFAQVHKDGLVACVGFSAIEGAMTVLQKDGPPKEVPFEDSSFTLVLEDGTVQELTALGLLDHWAPLNKMGEKLLRTLQEVKWGREVKLPYRNHAEEIKALTAQA